VNGTIILASEGAGDGLGGREFARQVRALEILWPLLGRHIAFHRRLVELTANVKAAVLLSQSIYWTRHGRDIDEAGGWFLKTSEQWRMETGLSAREQDTAREVLRELAIIDEQRIGFPARLHFRLCLDQIEALLGARIGRASGGLDWADGAAVAELLGPSLAYHRRLAGIGGGVHAGLLLSRALYLTRLQVRRQMQAWVGNSIAEWTQQIGLTRREQETARQELARAGIWEEMRVGVPPQRLARIRLDCLLALLAGDESGHAGGIVLPSSPECGIPTISIQQIGETSMQESHIHVSTKAPIQFRQKRHYSFDKNATSVSTKPPLQFQQKRHPSFDKSAKLSKQRSTRVLVQQPLTPEIIPCEGDAQGGGDLILPETLLPEERQAALVLVRRCAPNAQALLDELSARIQANAVHTSPVAYLRGLVRRALAGEFVPELGPRVAAVRRLRQEEQALRRQREAEEQRLAAEIATPEHQSKLATRRFELRQIAGALQAARPAEKRS
jgi:hypothetical protein